jgi:hypothetical protein
MDLSVGCTIFPNIVTAIAMESVMNTHMVVVDVVEEKLILGCRDIGPSHLVMGYSAHAVSRRID